MTLALMLLSFALVDVRQERVVDRQRVGNHRPTKETGFGDQSLTLGGLKSSLACAETSHSACRSAYSPADRPPGHANSTGRSHAKG
jgi:hypothetical protein